MPHFAYTSTKTSSCSCPFIILRNVFLCPFFSITCSNATLPHAFNIQNKQESNYVWHSSLTVQFFESIEAPTSSPCPRCAYPERSVVQVTIFRTKKLIKHFLCFCEHITFTIHIHQCIPNLSILFPYPFSTDIFMYFDTLVQCSCAATGFQDTNACDFIWNKVLLLHLTLLQELEASGLCPCVENKVHVQTSQHSMVHMLIMQLAH